jgi:GTP-binding protein
MQFIDEVVITVRGGDGGNGCVAFRREAHVPRGGPSGGDGGRGGDVVLVADPALSTLLDLRYQRSYRADSGRHGQGHDRHGRGARDLEVRIPCGTTVQDMETQEILSDLVDPGQRWVAAAGGQGGRGNLHFVSSTNRAPRRADPGEPGQERQLRLELKLLADVGLVGLPNSGKSSLISKVSAARPRVAEYPFTTLIPNLGVVGLSGERSFVVADIPGLIEGAHQGAGLGHRFLRHVERTRVLVFLLDDRHHLEGGPGDPQADLQLLRGELEAHDPRLLSKSALIALNKIDLLPSKRLAEVHNMFGGRTLYAVSAVSGQGVQALLEGIWKLLADTPKSPRTA